MREKITAVDLMSLGYNVNYFEAFDNASFNVTVFVGLTAKIMSLIKQYVYLFLVHLKLHFTRVAW